MDNLILFNVQTVQLKKGPLLILVADKTSILDAVEDDPKQSDRNLLSIKLTRSVTPTLSFSSRSRIIGRGSYFAKKIFSLVSWFMTWHK